MPTWSNITFQNRNSPLIEHLIFFHDHTLIILILTIFLTFYTIIIAIKIKSFNYQTIENQKIEIFWTWTPTILLIFIAFPSLKTLYILEERMIPTISIKITGHQWYWNYEYSNFKNLKIISNFKENDITRLINTSNRIVLPIITPVRAIITSKDVIHSWTIPNIGIKIDAIPGRINQIILIINRPGISIGQCSEICGAGHSFIPIKIEVTPMNFIKKS